MWEPRSVKHRHTALTSLARTKHDCAWSTALLPYPGDVFHISSHCKASSLATFVPTALLRCAPTKTPGLCSVPRRRRSSAHHLRHAHASATASVARLGPYRPHAAKAAGRLDRAMGQLVRVSLACPTCACARAAPPSNAATGLANTTTSRSAPASRNGTCPPARRPSAAARAIAPLRSRQIPTTRPATAHEVSAALASRATAASGYGALENLRDHHGLIMHRISL